MQDDFRSFGETLGDFRFGGVAVADFDGEEAGATVLDHEGVPFLPHTEEGAGGDLQDAGAFPDHHAGVDAVTVAEAIGGIDKIGDDIGSLLFNSQRGHLREAVGLHGAHAGAQRFRAAPVFDDNGGSGFHLHGVGGEQVDDDLDFIGIAQYDKGGAIRNHAFALLQDAQNAAARGGADRDELTGLVLLRF